MKKLLRFIQPIMTSCIFKSVLFPFGLLLFVVITGCTNVTKPIRISNGFCVPDIQAYGTGFNAQFTSCSTGTAGGNPNLFSRSDIDVCPKSVNISAQGTLAQFGGGFFDVITFQFLDTDTQTVKCSSTDLTNCPALSICNILDDFPIGPSLVHHNECYVPVQCTAPSSGGGLAQIWELPVIAIQPPSPPPQLDCAPQFACMWTVQIPGTVGGNVNIYTYIMQPPSICGPTLGVLPGDQSSIDLYNEGSQDGADLPSWVHPPTSDNPPVCVALPDSIRQNLFKASTAGDIHIELSLTDLSPNAGFLYAGFQCPLVHQNQSAPVLFQRCSAAFRNPCTGTGTGQCNALSFYGYSFANIPFGCHPGDFTDFYAVTITDPVLSVPTFFPPVFVGHC